ncbi:MAG: hypothetical protein PHV34_21550 [Verrucomicrobiae bacterium]|nr:hypothetical protein [Verrucomicrobiae bacterium]
MKRSIFRRWKRALGGMLLAVFMLAAAMAAAVFWRPGKILVFAVNRLLPGARFEVAEARWLASGALQLEHVRFADILKAPRVTLSWNWRDLPKHRLRELFVEYPEITVDLKDKLLFGGDEGGRDKGKGKVSRTWRLFETWYLDKLRVERGRLRLLGMGRRLPPIEMEVEGRFFDLPLTDELTEDDWSKKHCLELENLRFFSPLRPVRPVVRVERVAFEFRFAGLRDHQLDAMEFFRPTLVINEALFWLVRELRDAEGIANGGVSNDRAWRVRTLSIREGKLDIARLKGLASQYPLEFELRRQNLLLRDLSLADFPLELTIPAQDVMLNDWELELINLRGKVAFHMGETKKIQREGRIQLERPNDLVNTIYVDVIRWRKMEMNAGWLSLVFGDKGITGSFGAAFAGDYVAGGLEFGWDPSDPWGMWGGFAKVNARQVTETLVKDYFIMDGRAKLEFEARGRQQEFHGKLRLSSATSGMINIPSLDAMIEKFRNAATIEDEAKGLLCETLRNYPYRKYTLNVSYDKPDGTMLLDAEGPAGIRRMNLRWHGLRKESAGPVAGKS